ncbi:MAG: metalloregulator ArsR/SmtB family transcription factor [Proteobacteria bacterium]|nr:metalloregulator ArsR/SmtB family transcription factor [Pseudomonadota bacterium]
MPSQETLDSTFAALADPTRRAILARLADGDISVGELAEPFAMSLPAISQHLRVLEKANLIVRKKDAQWRRCHLRPESLRPAAEWISQYRVFWEGQFDALANYLDEIKETEEERSDSNK